LALRALERTLQITFVLGYGKTQLGRQLLEILPAADILEGVKDLGQRFWDCDIAITSAGYTKFEAGLTQTPFLMLSVQWHQIPLAQSFAAASGVKDLGYMAYVEPRDILRGLKELDCAEARRLRTHRARTVVDGRGFERVRNAVFEQHIIPSQ
jgi:spore coat polysaccharide biosynthesis predicted glycosyltransferase SpsG